MQFHLESMSNVHDITASPITAQMFGNAGVEHMVRELLIFELCQLIENMYRNSTVQRQIILRKLHIKITNIPLTIHMPSSKNIILWIKLRRPHMCMQC